MPKRSFPLELILRAHGPVELVNSEDETLWASDADDDFREEFNDEFLQEEDIGEILDYLEEHEILSPQETDHFVNQEWDFSIETLDTSEPEDDDDAGDEDDDEG